MLTKAELFKEKMNFIFIKVCENNLHTFTELFYIKGGKTDFEHRKINLKKNWLGKPTISKTFPKEYDKYPFSSLIYNEEKLFKNVHDFLEMDLVHFQEKIEAYVAFQNRIIVPNDLDYKYLYIFNRYVIEGDENIDYYHIEHMGIEDNRVKIKVYAPQNINRFNRKPYYGTLKQEGTKIILYFKNSDDYISAIFNTDLSNNHTQYLVGVGSGIADINQKIPVAKKVVFSKKKIEDSNTLYPILNETETISAIENSYEIKYTDRDFKAKHLHKYIDKIDRLNLLFTKLSQEKYYNSFYEQLAFKEFKATNNIFKKIEKRQSYYVEYRTRVIDILLKTYPHEKYQKIYMVMPTYQDNNIFTQETSKILELQQKLIDLSSSVAIEIIFIIESCKEPLIYEFKKFLAMAKSHIKINFALKKRVENEVNSIDFIFTDRKNFVITKFLRDTKPVFNLYQDRQTIEGHEAIYRKILNRSISYNDFMESQNSLCTQTNSILKSLSGEWYHYVYGSKKLWEDRVVIYNDGKVNYYCEDKSTKEGEIIQKEYQSIILLDDPITKRLFTIIFDHEPYQIQKAFFAKSIGKQFEKNLDMFAVGIFSRKKIPIEKAKEILGSFDDVTFIEKNNIRERLGDYLVETYSYQSTHED